MEGLTLNRLLGFLSQYGGWNLRKRTDGKYELKIYEEDRPRPRQKNGRKFQRAGRKRKLTSSILKTIIAEYSQLAKESGAPTGIEIPLLSVAANEFETCCEKAVSESGRQRMRSRIGSFGTVVSCDSLLWDNYDVEEDAELPEVRCEAAEQIRNDEANESQTPVRKLPTAENSFDLAEEWAELTTPVEDFSESKESSPDNMREGRILLREMKELRVEIKRMGDTSSINFPELKTKKSEAENKSAVLDWEAGELAYGIYVNLCGLND